LLSGVSGIESPLRQFFGAHGLTRGPCEQKQARKRAGSWPALSRACFTHPPSAKRHPEIGLHSPGFHAPSGEARPLGDAGFLRLSATYSGGLTWASTSKNLTPVITHRGIRTGSPSPSSTHPGESAGTTAGCRWGPAPRERYARYPKRRPCGPLSAAPCPFWAQQWERSFGRRQGAAPLP
jgi:hypothetical protein